MSDLREKALAEPRNMTDCTHPMERRLYSWAGNPVVGIRLGTVICEACGTYITDGVDPLEDPSRPEWQRLAEAGDYEAGDYEAASAAILAILARREWPSFIPPQKRDPAAKGQVGPPGEAP